jgi:hypothetical protein
VEGQPIKRAFSLEQLPVTAVILHTILVAVTVGLCLLPSSNRDSSIGFLMMVVTGYFVDLPIGLFVVESIRPAMSGSPWWPAVLISIYLVLGGLYWFLICTVIAGIGHAARRTRARKRSIPITPKSSH